MRHGPQSPFHALSIVDVFIAEGFKDEKRALAPKEPLSTGPYAFSAGHATASQTWAREDVLSSAWVGFLVGVPGDWHQSVAIQDNA